MTTQGYNLFFSFASPFGVPSLTALKCNYCIIFQDFEAHSGEISKTKDELVQGANKKRGCGAASLLWNFVITSF
ncbi:MAG: hypothetical protein EOO15_02030 [Chitinophagaceae bacterium]|nr:MAG: hypothetical protein EOO15_02030 [Chitinophagaceae bacterium]